jgi:hypothetical protein
MCTVPSAVNQETPHFTHSGHVLFRMSPHKKHQLFPYIDSSIDYLFRDWRWKISGKS